jgi:hypothetical protein
MNIKTTTSHEIKFTVEAFWDEEGGMGTDQFGGEVDALAEAVKLLELAKVSGKLSKGLEWVIVGYVKTNVS